MKKIRFLFWKKRRQTKKISMKIHTDIWQKKKKSFSVPSLKKCVFKTEFLKKEKKKFNLHLELGEKNSWLFSFLLHLFCQLVLFWNLFWKTIIQEKDHKLLICRLTFYLCSFKLLNVYNNVQSLIKYKKIFGHSDESIHWHSENWINSDFFFLLTHLLLFDLFLIA